jgi:hypothetical protein
LTCEGRGLRFFGLAGIILYIYLFLGAGKEGLL